MTTLNFPAGCPVTVQRDFGDTTFGVTQTFTSSPATYTETHAYTTGSGYTSNLNVLSNPTCGTSSASVTTSSAPSCATKSLCQALCKLFQFLFLLFGSAALVSLVATTSPACIVINSSLPAVATGFAITAGASLLILYLACRKCVCGFWRKLLGQLLTNVGAILFMFVLPLNCTQPVPFALPFYAFGAALLCLLVGASFVLYNLWFGFLRNQCPLTICDYWQAIKDALTVAILSAVLVYVSMGLGATIVHLGLALLVISLLLILSNQEILINQNANKC
ncbi:MAG TPA: hypothetical protein VJ723_01485 [Candidatus Angelobacter sp.]|nr:hypothetical protein [Candidatus Angelobacter sp.]